MPFDLGIPPKRRVLAFVNPVSGVKKAQSVFEEAHPVFEKAHMDVELILTSRRNHARDHV